MAAIKPGTDSYNELIDICVEYGIDSPKKLNMLRVGEALKQAFFDGQAFAATQIKEEDTE